MDSVKFLIPEDSLNIIISFSYPSYHLELLVFLFLIVVYLILYYLKNFKLKKESVVHTPIIYNSEPLKANTSLSTLIEEKEHIKIPKINLDKVNETFIINETVQRKNENK